MNTPQIRFTSEFRDTLHGVLERYSLSDMPVPLDMVQRAVDRVVALAGSVVELGSGPDTPMPRLPWNVRLSVEMNNAISVIAGIRLTKGVDKAAESDIVDGVNRAIAQRIALGRRVFVVVPWEEVAP